MGAFLGFLPASGNLGVWPGDGRIFGFVLEVGVDEDWISVIDRWFSLVDGDEDDFGVDIILTGGRGSC